jgi:ankyrin repeat protein
MLASYHGHAPLVKLLLQHGADPNTLNDRGQSPLAGAVFKGETEVVEVSLSLFALYRHPLSPGPISTKFEPLAIQQADSYYNRLS